MRRKKQRNESSLQQHSVGLIPGEFARRATNERKQRKQTNNAPRGKTLNTTRTDATIPIQQTAINMCELLESQNTVGAYQNRPRPADFATASQVLRRRQNPIGPDQARESER